MADSETVHDNDALLEELNKQKIKEYTPVIAYVVIVVVFGITGNILAVIFYGFKTRKNTNTVIISSLAAIDLATCVIESDEIIEICFSITFKNVGGCKFMYFINHFFVGSSVLVLLVICIDRYRRVCRYFAWQLTMVSLRAAIAAVIGVSLVLAIPSLIVIDVVRVNVTDDSGNIAQGYYCTHSKDQGLKKAISAFNFIDLTVVVLVTATFIVLYILIGRAIFISRRHIIIDNKKTIQYCNKSSVSESVDESVVEDKPSCSESGITLDTDNNESTMKKKKAKAPKGNRLTRKSTKTSKKKIHAETRITLMMIAITIGYLLSFLPYFIVNLAVKPNSEASEEFSVGIQIALRSFMLNSAINPYIIGVFNPSFRQFVLHAFCRCCLIRPPTVTSASTTID